jgi:hypothetical protein
MACCSPMNRLNSCQFPIRAVVGSGVCGGMVRDMMLEAIEKRFGDLRDLPGDDLAIMDVDD